MKLDPLFDNVVIKRDDAADKTKGGILLPDVAKDAPKRGTVVAVGNGVFKDGTFCETTVKANQRVLFGAFAGSEFEIDGQKYLIMKESEVLGVFFS